PEPEPKSESEQGPAATDQSEARSAAGRRTAEARSAGSAGWPARPTGRPEARPARSLGFLVRRIRSPAQRRGFSFSMVVASDRSGVDAPRSPPLPARLCLAMATVTALPL